MKKLIFAAGAVLSLSLVIAGCSSQAGEQFKAAPLPTPTMTATPTPEVTPSPALPVAPEGYEELPEIPSDEELEALIKKVEEEQGITITGSPSDLEIPESTATPIPSPIVNPEDSVYEPDAIPSDVATEQTPSTPPSSSSGISDEEREAMRWAAGLTDGSLTPPEIITGSGGSTMTKEEKEAQDQWMAEHGVGWE